MLTLALAAAVGVSAYWTALASRPVETEAPSSPDVPGLVPIGAGAQRGEAVTARDRAYLRGRRAGFREGRRAAVRKLRRTRAQIYRRGRLAGLGGLGSWSPGAAYVVTAAADGQGIAARVGPLVRGARYQLCRGGRRVCVTPPRG